MMFLQTHFIFFLFKTAGQTKRPNRPKQTIIFWVFDLVDGFGITKHNAAQRQR